MIVAISDLHLGDAASNRVGFVKFIEDYLKPRGDEITDLILLGDILDLWRRSNSRVILENMEILNSICTLGFKVTYLVGNHDMIMLDFDNREDGVGIPDETSWDSNNLTIGQSHQIVSGDTNFRFIHGHQMSYWYALPFYETFCRSMCQVPEVQSESTDIWSLMSREVDRLAPQTITRIEQLTQNTRSKILGRLAGPLEESTTPLEVSMLDDFNILQQFVELRTASNQDKNNILHSLRTEVASLMDGDALEVQTDSWSEFVDYVDKGSLEEIASRFLIAWSDILQWIKSNKSENKEIHRSRYIRIMRRLAAILLGNLNQNEFLIHGHGHNPYVDLDNRIADPGCWLGQKSSYISIDEGKIVCNQ